MKLTFKYSVLFFIVFEIGPAFAEIAVHAHAPVNEAPQVVAIQVDESGFTPSAIHVKARRDVDLQLTRTSKDTCATAIQFPSMKIKRDLPLGKMVSIHLKNVASGQIKFGCTDHMMFTGVISVD